MQSKLIGFVLILGGALLMLTKFELAPLESFISWPFIMFMIGAILLFVAFLKRIGSLALWAGIIAFLGLSVWGIKYVEGWPNHWSILLVFVGLSILLQYIITKHSMSGTVGSILVLTGIVAYPGVTELPIVSPITTVLHNFWPAFIVLLGLIFLSKK
ncbi:hypothetical protein [Laceyella putida]|uniref:DUF5668 domain-containing protein n=1 Tax=Laceyella putida TaxID=110101 RepID=A0ABW2RIN8_9BACL